MTHSNPKHPHIHVKLVGEDGNAFTILGRCQRAAHSAGLPAEEVQDFMTEAQSGDYNNLLQTCMRWFNCDNQNEEFEDE